MTPERLAEILASIDRGDTWDRTAVDLAREVRRLRALPVLRTCGECGHRLPSFCDHPSIMSLPKGRREIDYGAEPPSWCPFRG